MVTKFKLLLVKLKSLFRPTTVIIMILEGRAIKLKDLSQIMLLKRKMDQIVNRAIFIHIKDTK